MNHVQYLEHVSSRSASFRSRVSGRSALVPSVCMTLHWDDKHEYRKMRIDVFPRSHGHEYYSSLASFAKLDPLLNCSPVTSCS